MFPFHIFLNLMTDFRLILKAERESESSHSLIHSLIVLKSWIDRSHIPGAQAFEPSPAASQCANQQDTGI